MKLKYTILMYMVLLLICGCSSSHSYPPQTKQPSSLEQSDLSRSLEEEGDRPDTRFSMAYEGKEWSLNLASVGFDGIDPTTLDREAFYQWLSDVEKEVNRPPESAHFEKGKILSHRDGRKLDRSVVEGWLDHIHDYTGRTLEAPIQVWKPPITTTTLKRIREKRLSIYTTRYNPHNENRTHNIDLSTLAIDYRVIPVGEVFSFNQVVGVRTTERGYRPAPVIVRGEYTEGIGGGICQTSTTLFNSVERAGLRILQRVSHSKQVTYVPAGQDATVSWGGPDFRFQNQLNRPILIRAKAKGGLLTVSIYGSSDILYKPRPTPEPPAEEPKTEKVPKPKRRQPLNRAKEYKKAPLPQTRFEISG
ncbi:VanW family protein [Salinithrix halophila]|uniref:VanW family protein n=1 Tax=Salinithrix halophila TaxID=1485204 RepID=A0ABV8JE59_9BACL